MGSFSFRPSRSKKKSAGKVLNSARGGGGARILGVELADMVQYIRHTQVQSHMAYKKGGGLKICVAVQFLIFF